MNKMSALITFDLKKADCKYYRIIKRELSYYGIVNSFISNIGETKLPNNTYLYNGKHEDINKAKNFLSVTVKDILNKHNIAGVYCVFVADNFVLHEKKALRAKLNK